jgi:hypothetical protein
LIPFTYQLSIKESSPVLYLKSRTNQDDTELWIHPSGLVEHVGRSNSLGEFLGLPWGQGSAQLTPQQIEQGLNRFADHWRLVLGYPPKNTL